MNIRTIIEINHDNLGEALHHMEALIQALRGTRITEALNKIQGPVDFGSGIRVLTQRHHSEDTFLQVGLRGKSRVG